MKWQTLLLSLFFLAIGTQVQAQVEDLTQDRNFFQKQSAVYQKWLDHTGIGKVLRVRELEVERQELRLYLEFRYSDIDSIMSAWNELKQAYEALNPISLEQELFYKMVNLMELRQSLGTVLIFDTYDYREEPLFMRAIYFDNGRVQVTENNPKSKIREFAILPGKGLQGKMKQQAIAEFKRRNTKEEVFRKIFEGVKQQLEQNTCEGRQPQVRLVESDDVLRFEAVDLCRVVLTESADPLLARLLNTFGLEVNWVKREKLYFRITYAELPEGFALKVVIDGRYGSGIHSEVGRNGYYNMEIEFDDYLERYADQFKQQLQRIVLK